MIEFILNDKKVQTEAKSGMSLLHFIREEQGLKGTKAGCKEGDCGACTVLSGSLHKDNKLHYVSLTSCLTPLANAHGKHIVTVEGINLTNKLNIAQQSMHNNFATQCGYCTPGFVISLTGLSLREKPVTYTDSLNALSGNICRCTGYKSIEKAAKEVTEKLQKKNHHDSLNWLVKNKFIPDYFTDIPARLREIKNEQSFTEGVLVSGGTDLYVKHADALLDQEIQKASDFVPDKILFSNTKCKIGAGVNVTNLMENCEFARYFPYVKSHLKLVSSEPIRNMASIGGNFVNASPIGDMSIFFLALNSSLYIQSSIGAIREILLKDFFLDYKKMDLQDHEFIQHISFEIPDQNTYFNFEKVSKRTHLDIASVNTALNIKLNDNIIKETHIAVGGVAAIPKYLNQTNTYLKGKKLTVSTIIAAQDIMQKEISPISDVRGTETYKRLLARQLFYAHFLKLFPNLFKLKDLVA